MIKACIFDMDGTVANTINSISYFGNNALNKAGLPSIDTDTYKKLVGNGAKVLVERMAPLGDPMELKLRGYSLSIRKADAGLIEVV